MKIVTFNIRCDCGVDQENNFEFRKPYILKKLAEERPDIICFQEVMSHMAIWLNDSLPDYNIVGCGRDENLDGEQMTIAFRRDSFSLISLCNFWHSDTPKVVGSRFFDQSVFPRLCTECYLMEHKSKKIIRVVNTHLDHTSSAVRRKEIELVMNTISSVSMYKESVTFFVGDLNAIPESEEMTVLKAYPDFRDLTKDIGITYHGYFRDEQTIKNEWSAQIDYIFVRGDVELKSVEKWMDVHKGVYLSDHYPVSVVVE
ncbi:MAG: endonuclease/exonuclease/phosphatase family protein [Erysipelothrix sp.]|nr:endonuclease/exonuclease/phosphatase family protein [Erysipelothrix sp.]